MTISYFWLAYLDMQKKKEENDKMIEMGYASKSIFLEEVSGNKIVEEQEIINSSEHMKVVATTIIPSQVDKGYFNAWIYYKVKAEKIREIEAQQAIREVEKTPQEVKDEIMQRAMPEIKLPDIPIKLEGAGDSTLQGSSDKQEDKEDIKINI